MNKSTLITPDEAYKSISGSGLPDDNPRCLLLAEAVRKSGINLCVDMSEQQDESLLLDLKRSQVRFMLECNKRLKIKSEIRNDLVLLSSYLEGSDWSEFICQSASDLMFMPRRHLVGIQTQKRITAIEAASQN